MAVVVGFSKVWMEPWCDFQQVVCRGSGSRVGDWVPVAPRLCVALTVRKSEFQTESPMALEHRTQAHGRHRGTGQKSLGMSGIFNIVLYLEKQI